MTLQAIKAKNLKGSTGLEREVAHRSFYYGPNGCGKTTLSSAIYLLLKGYVPGHGATNQAIMKLAKDPEKQLGVGGTIDGVKFGRFWAPTGKTVTQKFSVEGEAVSRDEFIIQMARVGNPRLFDAETFRRASAAQRVYQLIPDHTLDGVDAKLKIYSPRAAPGATAALESLKVIETTMAAAGCTSCAAKIAITMERKQFQKKVADQNLLEACEAEKKDLVDAALPVIFGIKFTYEYGQLSIFDGGRDYDTLSGGEKVRADCRLGMATANIVILEGAELDRKAMGKMQKEITGLPAQCIINSWDTPQLLDGWMCMMVDDYKEMIEK